MYLSSFEVHFPALFPVMHLVTRSFHDGLVIYIRCQIPIKYKNMNRVRLFSLAHFTNVL